MAQSVSGTKGKAATPAKLPSGGKTGRAERHAPQVATKRPNAGQSAAAGAQTGTAPTPARKAAKTPGKRAAATKPATKRKPSTAESPGRKPAAKKSAVPKSAVVTAAKASGARAARAGKPAGQATSETPAQARTGPVRAAGSPAQGFHRDAFLGILGPENLEAWLQCGSALAQGADRLRREMAAFVQANVETNLATAQGLVAARGLGDLMRIHGAYVQSRCDNLFTRSARIAALTTETARHALAPWQAQMARAADDTLAARRR